MLATKEARLRFIKRSQKSHRKINEKSKRLIRGVGDIDGKWDSDYVIPVKKEDILEEFEHITKYGADTFRLTELQDVDVDA